MSPRLSRPTELALPVGFGRSWCSRSRVQRIHSDHDISLSGEEDLEVTVCVPAVFPLLIQDYVQTLQYRVRLGRMTRCRRRLADALKLLRFESLDSRLHIVHSLSAHFEDLIEPRVSCAVQSDGRGV